METVGVTTKITKSNSTPTPIRKVKDQPLQRIPINRVRSAHLSPGLPTGLTRVNPGWVLSLILEKVGNTG